MGFTCSTVWTQSDEGQEVIQNGQMQLVWPYFVLFAIIQANEMGINRQIALQF